MKNTKVIPTILIISISCIVKNDTNWVSLSGSKCKDAIFQRSHRALPNSFSIYKLSDSICLQIESILPHILDSLNKLNESMPITSYKRQYFGLKTKKNSFIYVNLFPNEHVGYSYWREKPVWVLDGGKGFCGIVIDFDKMRVVEFAFNGEG